MHHLSMGEQQEAAPARNGLALQVVLKKGKTAARATK
jgi:hypothetical protein